MTNASAERPVTQLFDLTGRVALITGSSGWLGSAMSRALAEAGATVVATSREADKAAAVAAALPTPAGQKHLGLAFNPDQSETIAPFIADLVGRTGRIDALVNNGYGGPAPKIDTAKASDFDASYHSGVTSYFLLAREVADHLKARKSAGTIVNIASMYGVVASYPHVYDNLPVHSPPNYHALKGAVVHLTRHLAVYWAESGIRVNAISPGPFPTAAIEARMPTFIPRLAEKVPLGRIGQPEDLKGLIVLLCSDASAYITGQNILVDGGWTAW
ncbi:MAG TPA: SDR family oxidoreductase [Thermoflexales bacterium]|nr:SDR family oxidoreductase [Thermoflexales bacterium]HQX11909.1 SDR family oxidoreductase [Thermoflexales bacterium]